MSIRDYARRMRPPRALYCEFPLGRPLGRPGDPGFQLRVLREALRLLERPAGPVLEDFPEVITDEADQPLACTIPPLVLGDLPAPVAEARALAPAWRRSRTARGSTHVGRRWAPEEIPEAVARLVRLRDRQPWPSVFASEEELLLSVVDVRVYYEEAALALADHVPGARAATTWFYGSTETGRLLHELIELLPTIETDPPLGRATTWRFKPTYL